MAGFQEYNSRTNLSEKDQHLCMRDERIRHDTCQSFLTKTPNSVTSEQYARSRPQFPRSTHGTPGTMTPLLARKSVAFYDSGSLYTEARVIRDRRVNEIMNKKTLS